MACIPSEKVPSGQKILSDSELEALLEDEIDQIVDGLNERLSNIANGIAEANKGIGRYLNLLPKGSETPELQSVRSEKSDLIHERELLLGYLERVRRICYKKAG